MLMRSLLVWTLATVALALTPAPAGAQSPAERLCDAQFEDCRTPLLNLIRNETAGIDVAFWFMEDSRYVTELVRRHQAGVPIRILVDQRANASKRLNEQMLTDLKNAGIPMREKWSGDVLHFKMMYFHGQGVLEFSKANYTPLAFVPIQPNVNYDDEAIFFTDDPILTVSFRKRFDDLWVNTTQYRDFANMSGAPVRRCPTCTIHPSMNFPPTEDFSDRSVSRYDQEMQGIDAIVFRVTDHRHADAMIRAVGRGVPVRIISEPTEYRNPDRVWVGKHIDRMYMAGVQIKMANHGGIGHQASVVLHGLGEVIFGSSNWTTASAGYQDEHNFFYHPGLNKPWFFQWFADQFTRKWNDTSNYYTFSPLPPDVPVNIAPTLGAAVNGSTATLVWDGGPWAHLFDIYFGTTPDPPLIESDKELGSPLVGQTESYTVTGLQPGTTYYWRIVGKTWAQLARSGPTWSFTTAGAPGGGTSPFHGTPAPVPGTIQAEDFDNGGAGAAYFDTTAGNSGGAYRSTDVDIEPSGDTGGGYNLSKTRAGEWLRYTVEIATSGTYKFEARVANMGTGATFRVEVDGVDRTGPITVPDTGGWQIYQTVSKSGVQLTAGQHVVRIVLATQSTANGAGNFNWFRFTEESSTPPPSAAWGGTPVALPGRVQAENFDTAGAGVSYADADSGNRGGVYRPGDVDIDVTNDPNSAGYYVGWTRVGEWLGYTVNVTQTRTYAVAVRVANVGSGATFRILVDGVDRTGPVSLPDTGAWDSWQTITISGVPLTQGQRVIRIEMLTRNAENSGVGNFGYLQFQ
jgi:hypothetical protein